MLWPFLNKFKDYPKELPKVDTVSIGMNELRNVECTTLEPPFQVEIFLYKGSIEGCSGCANVQWVSATVQLSKQKKSGKTKDEVCFEY